MRTHSHEIVRAVLEAIDTADGTGQLRVENVDPDTVQSHLDLLYEAGIAVATDEAPFTQLTEAGMELLLHSRREADWYQATRRNPMQNNATVLQSLLLYLRREVPNCTSAG